jgi:hypothetical protein
MSKIQYMRLKRERSKEFDLCAKIPRYGTQVHKNFKQYIYKQLILIRLDVLEPLAIRKAFKQM